MLKNFDSSAWANGPPRLSKSDVNIWSRHFSTPELIDLSNTCEETPNRPDILERSNITENKIDIKNSNIKISRANTGLCGTGSNKYFSLVVPNRVTPRGGEFLCQTLNAEMYSWLRQIKERNSTQRNNAISKDGKFSHLLYYLPTFCIMVISVITLFLDESHFEATVMLSLTAMLVLYTLFQSITTEIPSTAYLKLLDIWLIICLVLPFVIFMIEVILEIWKRRLENQNNFIVVKVGDVVKRIPDPGRHRTRLGFKMAMQIIFPIICVVFLVMYAFMINNSLN